MGSMWVFSGENRTSNIVFAQLKTIFFHMGLPTKNPQVYGAHVAHLKTRCIPDGPSYPEPTSTNTYRPHMGPMWVFGGDNCTSKIVFTQLKTRCISDGPSHQEPTGIRSPRGPYKKQMYTRWAFPSRTHKYQHI